MGRQLRNYEVQGEVGRGGMAVVYRAVHTELDRTVAIKELQSSFRSDEEMVERFKREAKAVASLVHPNIVQIYDFWWNKNGCYLVMEYIDGVDLKEILRKCGRFPVPVVVAIGSLLCDALAYAHGQGIIHRDVKLSNILISKKGAVKLADFGIAQILHAQDLTPSGVRVGTPAYMSPEQIQGRVLEPTSDLFSLGVVFYEMLTGRKPFPEGSDTQMIYQVLHARPRPLRGLNPRVPFRLQRAILRCLKKKPGRRFADMGELKKSLSRWGPSGASEASAVIQSFLKEAGTRGLHPARKAVYGLARLRRVVLRVALMLLIGSLLLIPSLFYYLYTHPPHSP